MSKSIPQHQEHDPYLVPGVICEVWNVREHYVDTGYFWKYDKNGFPIFVESYYRGKLDVNNIFQSYQNYRPIGTEWDNAPKWALDPKNQDVCSTVDDSGEVYIWKYSDVICKDDYWTHEKYDEDIISICCGICPDKTRYEGEAWKTSLRMRPDWAKEML